jgi:hypothetical protein
MDQGTDEIVADATKDQRPGQSAGNSDVPAVMLVGRGLTWLNVSWRTGNCHMVRRADRATGELL